MYTRSAIMLCSETDVCLIYTRSARILLSDTHFAILLRSDTGLWSNVHTSWYSLTFRHAFCYDASF